MAPCHRNPQIHGRRPRSNRKPLSLRPAPRRGAYHSPRRPPPRPPPRIQGLATPPPDQPRAPDQRGSRTDLLLAAAGVVALAAADPAPVAAAAAVAGVGQLRRSALAAPPGNGQPLGVLDRGAPDWASSIAAGALMQPAVNMGAAGGGRPGAAPLLPLLPELALILPDRPPAGGGRRCCHPVITRRPAAGAFRERRRRRPRDLRSPGSAAAPGPSRPATAPASRPSPGGAKRALLESR